MLVVTCITQEAFTGRGSICPLSVVMYSFFRRSRVHSYTAVKNHLGHDATLTNKAHHDINCNRLLEILSTTSYKLDFQTQNRMSCKFCRIKARVIGWIVVEQSIMPN